MFSDEAKELFNHTGVRTY